MTSRLLPLALLVAVLVAPLPARAHGVGTSQVHVRVDGARIEGYWEIHISDARIALGLPAEPANDVGFRDLEAREAELKALLAQQLSYAGDSVACPVEISSAPMELDSDYHVIRLHVLAVCESPLTRLRVSTQFMFDRDSTHRVYFSVEDARVINAGVFRKDLRSVTIPVRQFHAGEVLFEFFRDGVWRMWSSLDHLLFLVALLLPAPLVRTGGDWQPRGALGLTAREAMKVVVAFAVAHSITLCLSFFDVLVPPAPWVQGGIAVSMFVAAWNNIRPFLPGRAWTMALVFGLVHGLGFAGALKNMGLPRQSQWLALAAFNLGIEIGQLALALGILPLLHLLSRRRAYARIVMGAGSLGIAWLAVIWLLERGFGIAVVPRR